MSQDLEELTAKGRLLEKMNLLHLKRALTPKIRDQELLTHPLVYCTWISEFTKQDVTESEF